MTRILISLTCLLFFLASCGGDEDCSSTPAAGTIDGNAFTFGFGTAVDNDEGGFDIRMYHMSEIQTDSCMGSSGDFVSILGSLPSQAAGRVELEIDLTNFTGQTLTMFNPDGFNNIIAIDGYVEVTSVTAESVIGYLDINDGDNKDDSVCGSFTLTRCEW